MAGQFKLLFSAPEVSPRLMGWDLISSKITSRSHSLHTTLKLLKLLKSVGYNNKVII